MSPDFDWQPIWLSLQVASVAVAVAVVVGILAARMVPARSLSARVVIEAFLLLPLVLPPVVTGYALLLLFGKNGFIGARLARAGVQMLFTPTAAIIASAVVALPLMYSSAKAAFGTLDKHCLEAARCCGASTARVFWSIEVPLAWRGLVAGGVLSFARALGEFGATIMVAGNIAGKTTTAPVAIYMAVESGEFGTARNYVILLTAINLLFLLFLHIWTNTLERGISQ
jgi:molybdate transport system permease protein